MASNARNLSKLLGTSTQVPTTALPPAIADLETVGQTLSGGEIAPSSIKSNTLTQSFDSNQAVTFNMADSIDAVSPIVSVFKEVPQSGFSSKGQWDVNANATNYEFFDEKPISYASTTLTPSATGDGTFTNSNPVVVEFDVANMTYNNKTYDFASQSTVPEGGGWGNNGTVFFMCTNSFSRMYSYTASTAYDISTLTYDNKYIAISSPYSDPCDVIISDDGTKFWGTGKTDVIVGEFVMSTPFDLSTATYNNSSLDMSAQLDGNARSISFGDNGTKLYATGYGASNVNSKVVQYNLSTAYDLSTASYSGNSINLTSTYPGVTTAKINADGTKMLIAAYRQDEVHLFTLSTPYDLSTASDSGISYNFSSTVNTTANSTCGGTTNPDGSEFYYFGGFAVDGNSYQFNMGGSSVFNSSDVGKKVVGNSGSAIITATSGTYTSVTPFADTSAISSWQLFGAEGKADGSGIQLTSIGGGYDFPNLSYTGRSFYLTGAVATLTNANGMAMKPDGTKMWVLDRASDKIVEFSLSTPYEINTASSTGTTLDIFSYESVGTGIHVNSEGTRLIIIGSNQDEWNEFHLSTGWDLTTATHDQVTSIASITSGVTGPQDLVFNDDGTRMFVLSPNTDNIFGYTLSTAFDIRANQLTSAGSLSIASIEGSPGALNINNDGTELYISGTQYDNLQMLKLDTAYDLSSYNASASLTYSWTSDGTGIGTTAVEGITISKSGTKLYLTAGNEYIYEYDFGAAGADNFNSYSPALTNSSTGQINSSSWLDINSMTADETKNDGDIFYAVSTDNRTSWSVAKASDGVRKIVKNNSGTWQYNNDAGITIGYDFSNPTAGATSTFTAPDWHVLAFNTDGTKLIALDGGYLKLKSYNLSSAWDISTISSSADAESTISTGDFIGATISADGTKLIGYVNSIAYVYEYTMSTPFDVTTLTADGNTNSLGGASTANAFNWFIKPGTYNTVYAVINRHLYKYTFTGGSIITGTVTRDANFLDLDPANQKSYINNSQLQFKPDGTEFYIGQGTDSIIEKWTLSTAWDITTATKSSETVTSVDARSIWLKPNGEKIYYIDQSDSNKIKEINIGGLEYGTSETWVNGTNNNEHATLQQALTSQALNRMNKAQLDAVADGYHFSQDSADTLDLMIAPYAASGTSPISDGVTINYDAEALIREAIPGTDYIAEFPNPTTLNITAVGAANLKIRAQ